MSVSQNFPTIFPSLSLDFASVKKLDSRITFSRPTSAVYYDGKTSSKAEENLLLRSQEFDNAAWTKVRTTVVANTTTAPDGTTTAETMTATIDTGAHTVNQSITSVSGKEYSESIFVQAGTHDFVQLYVNAIAADFANFDLSTGTVGSTGGSATDSASIEDFGGGWYRISISYTAIGASNYLVFAIVSSSTAVRGESWTPLGTETVFLWGAQLEQRDTVTAYTPTTTQPITNYIPTLLSAPSNVARFDHNPVTGESLGLLVEEQRSNLLTYSEDFENEVWSKDGATISANTVIAPDGTLTGDKIVTTTANSDHRIFQSSSLTVGVVSTLSVYAKAAGYRYVGLLNADPNGTAVFDLQAGVVTSTGANITATTITAVGNGWYRCTATSATTAYQIKQIRVFNDGTQSGAIFTGDGYSGIYIWGASLEQGGFSTSYIKTVASQVTRSADSASMTGANFSDWYRADEGTLYTESESNGSLSVGPISAEISNGTVTQRIFTGQFVSGVVRSLFVTTDGVNWVFLQNTVNPIGYIKSSGAYKFNDFAGTVNGGTVLTDTNGILPTVNKLNIGSSDSISGQYLNGHIKKLSYYPIRLSNENLQALTS